MKITRTIAETRAALAHEKVGLVPTMGAYHAGHLSLFAAAREENDLVVASLFVNPAQFGDPADLARYPRDEAADAAIAEEAGVDVLFAPPLEELYPPGYETWVDVTEASHGLEGAFRPGHFRGVATICLKLFNIVRPRRAYFGQKDAQQVEVVRRMIRDLNLDVELRVLPTVRDADGLALSSRNALLAPEEREAALALPRALATGDPAQARALLDGLDVDYVEVAPFDPPTLAAADPRRLRPPDRQRPTRRRHAMSAMPAGKLPLPELAAMKARGDKIVMVTAYDAPGARFAEDAGIDIVLVGDTAAMVVLGHEGTTVPVTVDEMLFLTRTVSRHSQPAAGRRRPARSARSRSRTTTPFARRSASSRRAAPTSSSWRAPARWSPACGGSSSRASP